MVTMESVLNKKYLRTQIRNAMRFSDKDVDAIETLNQGNIILALIEIREAIEEGFARLDQTHGEGAKMIVECKDSLDSFLAERLEADKTLAGLYASIWAKHSKNDEEPEMLVDVPKKSAVTLDVGDFGKVPSDSGVA